MMRWLRGGRWVKKVLDDDKGIEGREVGLKEGRGVLWC